MKEWCTPVYQFVMSNLSGEATRHSTCRHGTREATLWSGCYWVSMKSEQGLLAVRLKRRPAKVDSWRSTQRAHRLILGLHIWLTSFLLTPYICRHLRQLRFVLFSWALLHPGATLLFKMASLMSRNPLKATGGLPCPEVSLSTAPTLSSTGTLSWMASQGLKMKRWWLYLI